MKFRMIESFYDIGDNEVEELAHDLFIKFENLFDRTAFDTDYTVYYNEIPRRSEILTEFEDYPNFAENIIEMLDENIEDFADEGDADEDTIDIEELLTNIEEYCYEYAEDYLNEV